MTLESVETSSKSFIIIINFIVKSIIIETFLLASINDDTLNLDFTGKPSEPVNVTVREIQSNNRSCKLYYKLNWDPPVDSGNIPITKYLVESHPVINRRKNRTVTYSTEHTVCKVQTSDHPDELIVNIRGVNKVGHGLKSENIKMLFYRECFLEFTVQLILIIV